MTPTPEDYAINPKEALDINAKATQGTWLHITSPTARENIYFVEKDMPLHLAGICGNATGLLEDSANARAIAYNHNNTPGLARRLMELEKAAISWLDAKDNLNSADNSKVMATYGAYVDAGDRLSRLAERIRKEMENAKTNE